MNISPVSNIMLFFFLLNGRSLKPYNIKEKNKIITYALLIVSSKKKIRIIVCNRKNKKVFAIIPMSM